MRFDRGRAEWSPRERFATGIILGLGLVLIIHTLGILLSLGGMGLLVYYTLQCAKAEEEKQIIPQLEGRIGALEEPVAPWQALEENISALIFREFSVAIESLRHEVQQVARYWNPLANPLAARLEALARFLSSYNDAYFARQQELHATFFSVQELGIGKPFNAQHVRAILTNEYHTLVVAGPGAGKTQVITGRVAFYASKKLVPPRRFACLPSTIARRGR